MELKRNSWPTAILLVLAIPSYYWLLLFNFRESDPLLFAGGLGVAAVLTWSEGTRLSAGLTWAFLLSAVVMTPSCDISSEGTSCGSVVGSLVRTNLPALLWEESDGTFLPLLIGAGAATLVGAWIVARRDKSGPTPFS